MRLMSRGSLLGCCLVLVGTPVHADNCDAIQAQIDARIRASGINDFTLKAVASGVSAPGKTVGSCANGSRKILYSRPAAGGGGAKSPVITECKDGSVVVGGDCKR